MGDCPPYYAKGGKRPPPPNPGCGTVVRVQTGVWNTCNEFHDQKKRGGGIRKETHPNIHSENHWVVGL